MGEPDITIDHATHDYHGVFNILSGGYSLEFDIDLPQGEARTISEELRGFCQELVGFQGHTYAPDDDVLIQYFRLTSRLERSGFHLHARLKLTRRKEGDQGVPVAVLSIQPIPVEVEAPIIELPIKRQTHQEILDELDDPEHFVFWHGLTENHIEAFKQLLEMATDERSIHAYLKANPIWLVQPFSSGHGRWVYPSKYLGSQHEMDFLILTKDSSGFEWTTVELEPPNEKPFLKNGTPGKRLRDALNQIDQWRIWLRNNLSYAQKPSTEKGLGLTNITGRTKALIIIGREVDFPESTNEWRRVQRDDYNIRIHSYDWLLREGRIHPE